MPARPGRGCKRRPLDRRTRHGASSCSIREPSCARDAPGALLERSRSRATGWGRTVTEGAVGITIGGSRTPRLIGRDSPASPHDPATRERRDAAASARCLVWMTSRARGRVPFHRSIRRSWRFTRRSMRRSCRSILRSCRRCIPRGCIRMMAPSANLAAWRAGRGVVTTAALAPFLGRWTLPSPRPSHRLSGAARARRPWPEGIEPSGAEVEEDRTQPHPLGAGDDGPPMRGRAWAIRIGRTRLGPRPPPFGRSLIPLM